MTAAAKLTVQPVILCGGSGTRLWPLSRAGFPKQFLVLSGVNSLFQQAVERVNSLVADDIQVSETLVVTNEDHRFLALDQLRELKSVSATLLLEPVGRNTAAALTLAALQATEAGEDPILVVTPADQTVADNAAFTQALQEATREAATGAIVILGITPNRPETGYGYIKVKAGSPRFAREDNDPSLKVKAGSPPATLRSRLKAAREDNDPSLRGGEADAAIQILPVDRFVEKPDADTAQRYLDEGGYYWNAGMFVLKASAWLSALERFRPDIANATRAAWEARVRDTHHSPLPTSLSFIRPDKTKFTAIPSESIDYAVMEKIAAPATPHSPLPTPHSLLMIPLDAGWNDLGAWDAVWQVGSRDADGNVVKGDTLHVDTSNTLIHATSRLVSVVGVDNLVIIETADAVLVADRTRSQDVKKIVDALTNSSLRPHHSALPLTHRKVHRPWGWYDSIDEENRFKVKRIQVKPGASLSLQKHHHRAEHWIVVKGTAEITCGDKVILLTENQSTYIPLGEMHRLANPGTIALEIIEVQSGSYLGEDDIVRFEDSYGR